MQAYIPTFIPTMSPEFNCWRLWEVWRFTLRQEFAWRTARKTKHKWQEVMRVICLEHACEQERTLITWVNKYKPQGDWTNQKWLCEQNLRARN